MTVYTSGPIKVGPLKDRTESLSRVDVVFYGIDHSGPSFEARIFLDNPGADASTPMDADHGFAGTFPIFGHGGCFGDEGHCEVPTRPVSAFDRRPPHQLTPTI